ncbi:MAG: putative transposase [Candidatus Dormibacteria bacterium]
MGARTAQAILPLAPWEARQVGPLAALLETEEGGQLFIQGWATHSWAAGDQAGRRLAALQLLQSGAAKVGEVAEGFDTNPVTVWRWKRAYTQDAVAGLLPRQHGPKRASKVTGKVAGQILAMNKEGVSQHQIAAQVGLSVTTVRRVLGLTGPAVRLAAEPSENGEAVEDAAVPSLVAVAPPAPRTEERQAARAGVLVEAEPVFTEGAELPLLGLLLALPTLAATGLLEEASDLFGQLRNGFYGLRASLLTFFFLALIREPRAEGATRIVPADLGRVLALDRAPEVKTLRRKLAEMGGLKLGSQLMGRLARRHADQHPEAMGYLYIDGHVRVYNGKRALPKVHSTRLRIAMPATHETWVGDANGDPVLVVIAPLQTSMVDEIRELLPELRRLVGDRRLTIVFDRGGWSPQFFAEMVGAGFDFLTYRKSPLRSEPRRSFTEHQLERDGVTHSYTLADRWVRLRLSQRRKGELKTLRVRQVTRLTPDGHQTPILTSHADLTAAEVAYRMFARWRQENYFKYGRQHFALDALDTYAAVVDDPTRLVPNPARKKLARRLARARLGLVEAQAAYGAAAAGNQEAQRPTMRGFKIANAAVGQQVIKAQEVLRSLEAERDRTPNKVPLALVRPEARLLETERKLLTHAVRMSAYNSESALARLLGPLYARSADEGRALLREAFRDPGDLRCANGRLEVCLNPLSAPRRTRALAALCDLLNDTETTYPGTKMVLHYSVKDHPSLTSTAPLCQ